MRRMTSKALSSPSVGPSRGLWPGHVLAPFRGTSRCGAPLLGAPLLGAPLLGTLLLGASLLGTLLLGAGCLETRCKSDLACPVGQRCNRASGACYEADSGVAHPLDARPDGAPSDSGVDGATDAAPPCDGSASCTDPQAPICDQGTGACRPCTAGAAGDAECADRDALLPLCHGPSGVCVECTDSALHCDAAPGEPVCDALTHACRACTAGTAGDAECAARSQAAPVCEGVGGVCVECTDSALHCAASPGEPICDLSSHACRGCSSHEECAPPLGGGVCEVTTGECLAESEVIYVDEAACPGAGTGTRLDPFCVLQDGVDAATSGRSTLLVLAGTYAPISLVDAGPLWIVGEAGAEVVASFTPSSGVYASGTSDLTIEGLTIRSEGGTGAGVECVGSLTVHPSVTLRGCTVSNNSGGGVTATSCTVTLEGNSLTNNSGGGVTATSCTVTLDGNDLRGNPGGGVSLSSSTFMVVNNFVVLNGGAATSYGGLRITSPGATAILEFNTVAENVAGAGIAAGIRCDDPVNVGSCIVVTNSGSDLSSSCSASHSFTTSNGDPLFVGGGDYHLAAGSPCIDAGDPASTLDHDVDGEARPLGLGPDIGADEAM